MSSPGLPRQGAILMQQVRLFRGLLLGMLVLLALATALSPLASGRGALTFEGLAPNLFLASVFLISLWLLSRQRFEVAVWLVTGATFLAASRRLAAAGIEYEANLLIFIAPITLAGLLLGRRALFVSGGLSLAVVLAVFTLERLGSPLVAGGAASHGPVGAVIIFLVIASLLVLFLDRFALTLYDALARAAAREADLQREVALREQAEMRVRLASDAAHVGLWSWDMETGELEWSDTTRQLFGVSQDTPVVLETFLQCVHPEDRERMRNAVATSHGGEFTYRVQFPDGRVRWLVERGQMMVRPDGSRQMLGATYDITPLKEAESVLEERVAARTAQLQEANRELEAFTYSASHDLRAPLRGINGYSQALLEEYGHQLDQTARDYLARIGAGATRMGALIDDLLGLSRIARKAMEPHPLDLSELARSVAAELEAEEPERRVEIRIADGLRAWGDAGLVRIALGNLLGNAWKFSAGRQDACIEVGWSAEHDAFYIRDNGAGFDMAYANKLFTPFQRLHSPGEYEGTGIGLATTQRVVARHGGRIWAESAPGRGAIFYFTLPLRGARGGSA